MSINSKTPLVQTDEESDVYQVEEIKDKRRKGGKTEYLVKWFGYSDKDNTWEEESNIFDKQMIQAFEESRATKKRNSKKTSMEKTPDVKKKKVSTKVVDSNEIETKENNVNVGNVRMHTLEHLNEFGYSIDAVETVYKNNDVIMAVVRFKNGETGCYNVDFLEEKAPYQLLQYYKTKMVFMDSKDESTEVGK